MDRVVTPLRVSQLFNASRPMGPTQASVFVAYRFSVPASLTFRRRVEERARELAGVRTIHFTDGHVEGGEDWSRVIRARIAAAWFGVADMSGPSKEVAFELGLLAGLGKRVLPAVESPEARSRLPRWVTARQVMSFENGDRLDDIARQVVGLASGGRPSLEGVVISDPGVSLCLRPSSAPVSVADIQRIWAERSLEPPTILTEDSEVQSVDRLKTLMRATFVAWFPGSPSLDILGNFLSGAIIARPIAGRSGRLPRQVHLFAESDIALGMAVADAARRAEDQVVPHLPIFESVSMAVSSHSSRYFAWLQRVESRLPGLVEASEDGE